MPADETNSETRRREIERIYHAALVLTPAERLTFLTQRCAGDTTLHAEVTSLLASNTGFLQQPVAKRTDAILDDEAMADTEIMSGPSKFAAPADLGGKLAGRYEIIKRLGSGGFGDVYEAIDTKVMSRPVVIKVLKDEVMKEDDAKRTWVLTKFKHEIEVLAKLHDPGVVRIFDTDYLADGRPYIVMEFVEGLDLRHFIKRVRLDQSRELGLELRDVAEIIKQVGRTLTATHEVQVFHRDLKPENIMLRRDLSGDLQVKVIDFGLAKVKNSVVMQSTSSGTIVAGTWRYMAPEQLSGKKVDAACDIFALGTLAYEIITGRHPFPARDRLQLKEMQEQGVRVKPRDLNPDLPVKAQEQILKALEYYPAERHKRARDFGDELAKALATAEDLVRPGETKEGSESQPLGTNAVDFSQNNAIDALSIGETSAKSAWSLKQPWLYLVGLSLLALLLGGVGWKFFRIPTSPIAAVGPEQALTLWLHAKMPKGDGRFDEFDSTGEEAFKAGSKISFRVEAEQTGYLYMIDEGMGDNNIKQWTAIFPNPVDNNRSAQLIANQQQSITGITLDKNPGDEVIHFVWSAEPISDLEALFQFEFKDNDEGTFRDPIQQDTLRSFFQRYSESPNAKAFHNGTQPRVTLKGYGNPLVVSLTIKHRKYGN